jgi:uncharacterized membrane protein
MTDSHRVSEQPPRKRAALGKVSLLVALIAVALVIILMILYGWLTDNPSATAEQQEKLRTYANVISVAVPCAHAAGMFIAVAGLLFEGRGRFWSWLGLILNFLLLTLYVVFYLALNQIASST